MRVHVSVELPLASAAGPKPPRTEEMRLFEEAFRTLRSNLLLRVREGDKSFLVTSARPGEGKSTIVANLARILAAGNRKVLVVDADLRRPRLHDLLGVRNTQGLADLLSGSALPKAVYQRLGDGATILTSGAVPRDPQELLLAGNLESLLSQLKTEFDVVLFDSAPMLAFADTAVLAPKVDGLILVLKSGEVTTTEAVLMRDRLQSIGAKLAGCVLTCVPRLQLQPYHPYASEYEEPPVPIAAAAAAGVSAKTLAPRPVKVFAPPREAKSS